MNSIAFDVENEKTFSTKIERFFRRYQIVDLLKRCNAYKEQGFSVVALVSYLFTLVFQNRSLYQDVTYSSKTDFRKDTVYRFRNSSRIAWRRFTTLLSAKIISNEISPLTSEDRKNVFIIDDSIFERGGSKKVELLARLYDHARKRYTYGFRMLTLGWSDGVTFLPVNACLLSTENEDSRINDANLDIDERSNGWKARELAIKKATEVVPVLLDEAIKAGIKANYVLFDSWFSSPKTICEIKGQGLDVVAMVKKSGRIRYRFQGEMLSCKDIYRQMPKRRGRSRYLLSVPIELCHQNTAIPAKLVFVRNRNNKKEYLVLLSTDTSLSEDEVIRLYGKRWDIEVFFKTCKSLLRLTKECRSLSYDAMCAQVSIVFMRYMFLAVEVREDKDKRTMGPIFYLVTDELADLSFADVFNRMQEFFRYIVSEFHIDEQVFYALFCEFVSTLPKHFFGRRELMCSLDSFAHLHGCEV